MGKKISIKNGIRKWARIDQLRPTQLACGWQEVEAKEWEILGIPKRELEDWLSDHPIPVVAAPDGNLYLVDRHHMGLSMLRLEDRWNWESRRKNPGRENPYSQCYVNVVHDLSDMNLNKTEFFATLEAIGMLHPYDENGVRVGIEAIPKSLADLRDDPYRSLAGFARKAGAFEKSDTPYAEFAWADFYRTRIAVDKIKSDIQGTIAEALDISCTEDAKTLPGWTGLHGAGVIGGDPISHLVEKKKIRKH